MLALVVGWLLGADAGVADAGVALARDEELLRNLELLEVLDEAKDLELLEELSR